MASGRGGSNKMTRNKRTEAKKRKLAQQRARTFDNKMRKLKYRVRMHPKDRQALEALNLMLKK